jgi:3-deoxy-D-manno-octulosonic-acid transferase
MRLPHAFLYHIASRLAGPGLPLWLKWRLREGKEDRLRYREKLAKIAMQRPAGELIWIHAASVGESLSILPLIEAIRETATDKAILVTTVTLTSANLLEKKLPDGVIHQYAPVDNPSVVKKFLQHWQPSIALFVESEIWPNMITLTKKSGGELFLINARMSGRSFMRWQKMPALFTQLMDSFTAIFPQNEKSGDYFKKLGANNLKYLGNLKYDAPPLPADPKVSGQIIQQIGSRACWLAASTHEPEEMIAGDIQLTLRELHEDLLTIIVPRHPNRAGSIARQLREKGLKVAQRSKEEAITQETDIYLADSIGELGIFYRIAGIVFIGGSLINRGGQNPLEAARLDCAVITGPHMDNFPAIMADMIRNDACLRVHDAKGLQQAVEELLHQHEEQENLATNANKVVKEQGGAVEKIIAELTPHLQKQQGEKA